MAAPRAAGGGIIAITVVMFGFSGGVLWDLGYNYDGMAGSTLTKVHPATYLTIATFAWAAVTSGNPIGYAAKCMQRRPANLVLLLAAVAFALDIIVRTAPGLAGALDTYMGPALFVMMLADVEEPAMRRIEIALHVLLSVNALMGIAEFVLKVRFYPYRFDGAVFPTDTRSAALQGHPLVNAAITTWYLLTLLNGGRTLPEVFRIPLVGLQFAALVTFGGRAGMVISVILGGMYLIGVAHRALRSGRVSIAAAAASLVLTALVPAAVVGLAIGGFFDDLLSRFISDGGSANARIEMFAMFDTLSWRDLLVGPDTRLIENLRRVNGLEWGIENPFIKTILYYGIVMMLILAVATALFIWEIASHCGPGTWMAMIAFTILVNTSESISGKTTLLSKFAVLMLCLYRPPLGPVRPAASPDPAPG